MEIGNISPTTFYKDENVGQGNNNSVKKNIVFTNSSSINKALSTGKINVDGVSVDLSKEAMKALYEAREKLYADREAEALRYTAEYNVYAARQQKEASEDMSEDMAKALLTARRIANGDSVPAIDEKKLLEYDEELYQMAKASAMLHQMEEHRKYKSLYEDEKEREEGEYTDPAAEITPQKEYAVEVEVSVGDTVAAESISEGELTQ